jgi:hypothetical protein
MTELIQRIGIALAIGFLVGVERGWREHGSGALYLRDFARRDAGYPSLQP